MADLRPLYAVLEVASDASPDAIKVAYRRLALAHHPDKRRSDEDAALFSRIAFAYEVLGNAQRRKRYDLTGELPQNDAALGRQAGQTFLAEYVRAAPKASRVISQKDVSLHSLENYEVLEVDGRDVPEYMKGIVMQGLGYLVRVVEGMETKEVVLLRHYVMDQMYALLAYTPPLDDDAFSQRGYIITYYDHPLQAGITAAWSDQNDGRPRGGEEASLKTIEPAVFEQRRLAALEWHGPPPAAAAAGDAEKLPLVPGEGIGPERIALAARALVKKEPEVGSFGICQLRASLAELLNVAPGALDDVRSTELMGYVFVAMGEEEEDEDDADHPGGDVGGFLSAPSTNGASAPSRERPNVQTPETVSVKATGRVGRVLLHDPEDSDLTFKLRFSDGLDPAEDWFGAAAVEPCG